MTERTPNEEDDMVALTSAANAVRARLLSTVDALNRKRHEAFDIKLQARKHAVAIAVAASAIVVTSAGTIALVARSHARSRRRARFAMLTGFWRRPERSPRGASSFFGRLASSVLLSIATTALLIPVKRFFASVERA